MKKKSIVIILLTVMMLLCGNVVSNAAIEIKEGTTVLTNITISDSYTQCRNLTNSGATLAGSAVVPHLSTNKDWGAVSYMSQSRYGTNGAGKNTGVQITLNSVNYYSLNGNETGVMNWGKTNTFTSGLMQVYDPDASGASTYVSKLNENKNTRFVDNVNTSNFTVQNTLGMAFKESAGWYSSWSCYGTQQQYPASFRQGLFGFYVGGDGYSNDRRASGAAYNNVTFRPIIWNE